MLILNKFPTHIAKTNRKKGPQDYFKINGQAIYNSAVSKFTRGIVIENMHNWIIKELKQQELPSVTSPVQLKLDLYIPINYATVRRKKDGTVSWKPAKKGYRPNNDEDNLRSIWEKCIKDCITKLGIWEDDDMYICRGINSLVHFIDDLEDRKIEIDFVPIGI